MSGFPVRSILWSALAAAALLPQEKSAAALEAAPEAAGAAQQRAVYHGNAAACHLKLEQWAETAQVGTRAACLAWLGSLLLHVSCCMPTEPADKAGGRC